MTRSESCDAGQARFIRAGLDDMNLLAKHAYERILKYGETDELYVKYFGNASSATAAGFYAQLLYGNKPGVLFRCDNPDGNCNEVTAEGPWGESARSAEDTASVTDAACFNAAGHHRGKNATEQTVICPPTCETLRQIVTRGLSRSGTNTHLVHVDSRRKQLSTLCWDGVAIGSESPSLLLATDFMHRLIHVRLDFGFAHEFKVLILEAQVQVPSITYNRIHHGADSLGGVLALAAKNDTGTVTNQNTYQF